MFLHMSVILSTGDPCMKSLPVWPPVGLYPGGSLFRGGSVQGMSLFRGVSVQGMSHPGGLCLGRFSVKGVSVQGVSVQGVSVPGVSVQGGLCQGDPLRQRPPCGKEWAIRILLLKFNSYSRPCYLSEHITFLPLKNFQNFSEECTFYHPLPQSYCVEDIMLSASCRRY